MLFEKEYSKEKLAQPRLLGSLLTAMTEFATQTTAMRPSYIEMSSCCYYVSGRQRDVRLSS